MGRLSTPFTVGLLCSMSYPNHVYCGTAYHVRTGARRSCRLQIENTSVHVEAVDSHNSLRGGCAPTRTFPPLCEDPNRKSSVEQGHGARTSLERALEK